MGLNIWSCKLTIKNWFKVNWDCKCLIYPSFHDIRKKIFFWPRCVYLTLFCDVFHYLKLLKILINKRVNICHCSVLVLEQTYVPRVHARAKKRDWLLFLLWAHYFLVYLPAYHITCQTISSSLGHFCRICINLLPPYVSFIYQFWSSQ